MQAFRFALVALFLSFGTLLLSSAGPAMAGTCTNPKPCHVTTPQGNLQTHGTIKQPLDLWVEVCYPVEDWSSQLMRQGQKPFYVSLAVSGQQGVIRGIPRYQTREDMADAKLIKAECYKQHYQPGWVIMTITKCRKEGFYTFLTT